MHSFTSRASCPQHEVIPPYAPLYSNQPFESLSLTSTDVRCSSTLEGSRGSPGTGWSPFEVVSTSGYRFSTVSSPETSSDRMTRAPLDMSNLGYPCVCTCSRHPSRDPFLGSRGTSDDPITRETLLHYVSYIMHESSVIHPCRQRQPTPWRITDQVGPHIQGHTDRCLGTLQPPSASLAGPYTRKMPSKYQFGPQSRHFGSVRAIHRPWTELPPTQPF